MELGRLVGYKNVHKETNLGGKIARNFFFSLKKKMYFVCMAV